MAPRQQRSIIVQFEKGKTRNESLFGKDHLVVPMIAMVEGVRMGAAQSEPELGLAKEFGKLPISWANRPLVLNHPQVNGDFVSANTPEVLEAYQFGFTMNPQVKNKKLHLEAWIDTARVAELGGDFQTTVDRILAEEEVEVSVGFFSDVEATKGKFNGQAYGGIWRNIAPDHMAILTEGNIGACSVEAGCGIPRINQKGKEMADKPNTQCSCGGHNNQQEHDEAAGIDVTVNEGKDGETVVTIQKKTKTTPSLPGMKVNTAQVEVSEDQRLLDQRRAANGAIISQTMNTSLLSNEVQKIISQAIQKKVQGYAYLYGYNNEIAVYEKYNNSKDGYSGGYTCYQIGIDVQGAEVKFVGEPEEVILQTKVVPKDKVELTTNAKENDMADKTKEEEDKAKTAKTQEANPSAPVVQAAKEPTMEEYLATLPPAMREQVSSGLKVLADRKEVLIKALKAHPGNKFADDYLKVQTVEVLENMVAYLPPSYAGIATPAAPVIQSQAEKEQSETVPVPTIQWGPKAVDKAA